MVKKLSKDILGLGGASLGIGVGSMMTAKLGYGQEGFATAGKMMPVASMVMMGTNIVRMVKKSTKKRKKR